LEGDYTSTESSLQTTNDELAIQELKQSLEAFMDFKELTPEIIHRLIDRIEIKADGSPRIFYRFSNPSAYSLISINAQTPHASSGEKRLSVVSMTLSKTSNNS
jgi:hypothetical protein